MPYDSMYDDVDIPMPKRETHESIMALPEHVQKQILRNEYRGRKAYFETPNERLQWIYKSYYGTITQIDHEVGEILDTLEETGQADNTIIIFASDHGAQLLEHGLMDKNVLFEGSVRVPMMICYPETVREGTVDELVMSIDILPTLFEMIGLPVPDHCHGTSLLPLISDDAGAWVERDCVFSENVMPEVFGQIFTFTKDRGVMDVRHPDGKMVRTQKWKYNYYPGGGEELYDLENDPLESTNLAGDLEYDVTLKAMKQRLLDWMITATETEQIAPQWLID